MRALRRVKLNLMSVRALSASVLQDERTVSNILSGNCVLSMYPLGFVFEKKHFLNVVAKGVM